MTTRTHATTTTGLVAGPPRDRTRYLTASGVALWGAQLGQVAVPLTAVTVLHVGSSGTSLLQAALTLPFVLLGLPVGAWLDRVRRRPVMITADLVRVVALVTVPLAAWMGRLTMAQLLAVVTVQGVATVFFDLGTQSLVKDLAPGPLLARTNARLAMITQSALVAGPPLAGWAAGLLTAPTVLLLMAGGYLWSAAWLSSLTVREQPSRERQSGERQSHAQPSGDAARRHLLCEIGAGVVFVARQPVLRTVLIAGSMVNVGIAGVMTLLPVLALTRLGWSEGSLGLFLGAGGLGGLIGASMAVRLSARLGAGRAVLLVGAAVAPLAVTLPLVERPVPAPLAAVAWALVIFKVGFDSVVMTTFRQQVTPSDLLARVNGTMRVLFTGSVTLGAVTAGALASAIGIRWALGVSAACLACVWIPVALSPVRSLTVLVPTEPAAPATSVVPATVSASSPPAARSR